ncbi:hypothetical protein GCM10007874_46280 [Labrys miyagiensis]|uniref:Uncharacterized protein n=1 Tax=Labrys miyagiensis TaxID=346912 RepID=A0ABQ6CMM9_9HYPH|nr:hypothetical protein GCM10007874_46280 [Labrys miyagiensis]
MPASKYRKQDSAACPRCEAPAGYQPLIADDEALTFQIQANPWLPGVRSASSGMNYATCGRQAMTPSVRARTAGEARQVATPS